MRFNLNNYIFLILSIIFSLTQFFYSFGENLIHFGTSKTATFKYVPPQLNSVVGKLLELPEARDLLAQVSRQGGVSIILQNDTDGQFDALWDGDARVIKLNPHRHHNLGTWICSILFELHNASTNDYMLNLYRQAETNQMTKEIWVEHMERMEHANALNTCRLLEKGMAQNIYPPESRWTIFQSFDDYYKLQQISGHSQWLAKYYDQSNPYSNRKLFQGTIPGLNTMSSVDKKNFENYLVGKNRGLNQLSLNMQDRIVSSNSPGVQGGTNGPRRKNSAYSDYSNPQYGQSIY